MASAVEGEVVALDDGFVAEVEAAQPACGVTRHVGVAGGKERDPPGALLAVVDELVEHRVDGAGRTDRITRRQREAAEVGVGDERLTVGAEEEALVIAQREVGERVGAVELDQPAGVVPVAFGVRRARAQRPEQQEGDARPGRRCRGSAAPSGSTGEEQALVDVRAADADHALDDRLEAAGERQAGRRDDCARRPGW